MKNFLLFAFIFCNLTLFAQDMSVTPNPVYDFVIEDDTALYGHATFKNNSTVEKSYMWERTVLCGENVQETWFCDPFNCYLPNIGAKDFTLAAGEEGQFDFHARFTSVDDRALNALIKVYEIGNETNTLDVIYEYNSCAVGTNDLAINEIKLFPNPTTDHFTLTNIGSVKDVIIHNIIGAPVKQYLAEENASYSIGDLPAGVYMVQLSDANENNVGTKRVFKQ